MFFWDEDAKRLKDIELRLEEVLSEPFSEKTNEKAFQLIKEVNSNIDFLCKKKDACDLVDKHNLLQNQIHDLFTMLLGIEEQCRYISQIIKKFPQDNTQKPKRKYTKKKKVDQ